MIQNTFMGDKILNVFNAVIFMPDHNIIFLFLFINGIFLKMETQNKIIEHYSSNKPDLEHFDEAHMHLGGASSTSYFLERLQLRPEGSLMDIGCGRGASSYMAALHYAQNVWGVDLTPRLIEIANVLREKVAVSERLNFQVGTAMDLPFEDEKFDAAMMIFSGMNIQNKQKLYDQAYRCLKIGGVFGVFEPFLESDRNNSPNFPFPWAKTSQSSFVEPIQIIRRYLQNAGFEIIEEENSNAYALRALEKILEDQGPEIPFVNFQSAVQSKILSPFVVICKKV